MSALRNVSLKGKLAGVAGILLGLLVVQAVLELSGSTSHSVTLVMLAVGLAVGAGVTFLTHHTMSSSLHARG